jgi:hypothetical protein
MPWVNLQIVNKSVLDDGTQRINVVFSTDEPTPRTFQIPVDIPVGAIAGTFDVLARRALKRLNDKDAAAAQAAALPNSGAYTPSPEPPPPTPDPDETPKQQFLAQLQAIRQLDKAIALPITTGGTLTALTSSRATQLSALQTFYNAQSTVVRQKIVDAI